MCKPYFTVWKFNWKYHRNQNISMFFTSSIFSALVYILVLVLVFFLIWTSDTILYQITILLHFTSINGLKRYKTKSLAKIIYEFIFLTNGSTIGYVNKNGKMALLFLVHKKLYKKIWNMLSIIHSIGHLLNAYISFARVHTNRHIKSATVLSSKSFSRHYQKINCAVCTFNDDHFITLRNNIFISSPDVWYSDGLVLCSVSITHLDAFYYI